VISSDIILHIPHSSRYIPSEYRKQILLFEEELQTELLLMTDAYTDEIQEYLSADAVVFPYSRLLIDVERFRDDGQETMAQIGMGPVYTKTHDGRVMRRISLEEREDLLKKYYDPHHKRLSECVEKHIHENEQCLILDIHSFPSSPLPYEFDQSMDRPDICLGTDPFHTPASIIAIAKSCMEKAGLSVKINSPFSGSIVPMEFYQGETKVMSLMIEINRNLLMNEETGERKQEANNIFKIIREMARLI